MNILKQQEGSAIVELSLLMPLIVIFTILTMKLAISLQLKVAIADTSSQIAKIVSDRRNIFTGELTQDDLDDILEAFPNLEKNKISIYIEERTYDTQEYILKSKEFIDSGVEEGCSLEEKLPKFNLVNSFNKYQSVFRVTLCKKFVGTAFELLPNEISEITFSTVNIGKYH